MVLTLGGIRRANLETEIWLLTSQQLDLTGAAGLSILQVTVIVVLLVLTKRFEAGAHSSGVARPARPVRTSDLPVLVWTAAVLGFLALPVLGLVARSLQYDGRWTLANYAALGSDNTLLAVPVAQALSNSLQIAGVAATLAPFASIA